MIDIITNPLVVSGLMAIGRNVYGWLQKALEDGKIEKYEWSQLGQTVLRMGIFATFTYFGLNGINVDINAADATAIAGLVDVLRSMFQKKK